MKKLILAASALFLITAANSVSYAQETVKKEADKTTTIETWRQVMPQNEEPASVQIAAENAKGAPAADAEESPAQIEKRILGLEGKFMQALKLRDAETLNRLLADEFTPVGINLNGQQPDKTRFIEWATKNLQIKSYAVEKTAVQIFPATAIVTTVYKRQATVADVAADGDFTATDVWIKRGKQWRAVSHHVSQTPKQQP